LATNADARRINGERGRADRIRQANADRVTAAANANNLSNSLIADDGRFCEERNLNAGGPGRSPA
jgi:hypothetical protein